MLSQEVSAESTVTLKHGSIKASVPVNATKAQRHQALLEAFSAQEAELANTVTNAISTHQWSLMAEEFGDPESKVKGDVPKIETWFLTNPKFEEKGHCKDQPDYFLILEDDAAVNDANLKPMVEFLTKDL